MLRGPPNAFLTPKVPCGSRGRFSFHAGAESDRKTNKRTSPKLGDGVRGFKKALKDEARRLAVNFAKLPGYFIGHSIKPGCPVCCGERKWRNRSGLRPRVVHRQKSACPMAEMGHPRCFGHMVTTSAVTPIATKMV